jgi:hypothetical protein
MQVSPAGRIWHDLHHNAGANQLQTRYSTSSSHTYLDLHPSSLGYDVLRRALISASWIPPPLPRLPPSLLSPTP